MTIKDQQPSAILADHMDKLNPTRSQSLRATLEKPKYRKSLSMLASQKSYLNLTKSHYLQAIL